MIGKVFANRYRIGERLGGGGMALVYRAEDLQLGRDVAVKVLRGQFGLDEDFVRRFRREAQNAASLSHPNVVQIFDVGQDDEFYFIVMELVDGKTLKALISEQGPLAAMEAARVAAEILSALAHAHHHRIVHRDIKPHNILIAKDGRVKVTDFGIARATTTDTVSHTGSIIGSAHYFSPEQANGQPTGEKSDIYSVGVVLYEMMTGVVPFQGESPITVALKHIRDRVVPPSKLNSDVPLELERIILQAMEKEAEDRFESAMAMRESLEQFARDHAAGRTHIQTGDFPTMDLRGMRRIRARKAGEVETVSAKHHRRSPPPRKSYGWVWIVVIALFILGGIGTAIWSFVQFIEVPEVMVPDVRNIAVGKAQEQLRLMLLDGKVLSDQHSELPVNHVIRTDPPPGTTVKQGRTIDLVISRGPDEQLLPDVRGKPEDDARLELENAQFKVGQVTRKHSSGAEGVVLEMTPQPRTRSLVGTEVDLVVSLGPLKVPVITGMTIQQARQALLAVGLTVGKIEQIPDPTKPKEMVVASEPAQGTVVVPGQGITVYVAEGPPPEGRPFAQVIVVPGEPGKQFDFMVVLVDVVNEGIPNEELKVNERRRGGEKVSVTGSYRGKAYLRVIINGTVTQRIDLP